MKNINIYLKYLGFFLLFFIFSFCYSFFFSVVYNDEIWNFGVAYNIASGMIPYRDFNLVTTPLYPIIASFFIKLFGNYLYSFHIYNSLIISGIFLLMYKKLGLKSIILIPIVLLNGCCGYNILCVFLILALLFLEDENNEILAPLIISFLFLTKQTVGICLVVPMIYYSKNKIKSIIIFLIPILIFGIYLVYNNAFFQFVDYCFLGLFDFGKSNSIYFFLPVEFIVCIYLIFNLIKNKLRTKQLFYLLMFQIITVPICDDYHFMIGFIPLVYYWIFSLKIKRYQIKYLCIISMFFVFMWLFVAHSYETIYLYKDKGSYLYGRNLSEYATKYISDIGDYILEKEKDYDFIYFFSKNAYYIKLNIGYKLTKFDMICNGNMGYHGSIRYIDEVDSYCSNHKCMFVLLKGEFDGITQTNEEIVDYVKNNYNMVDDTYLLDIYNNARGVVYDKVCN